MVNKRQEIHLELVLNNLDLCILTETWIKEGDTITPTSLCSSGCKSLSISRHDKIGSGIAIVYKSNLNISIARGQPFKTIESTCISINTGNRLINLITIYRPPNSNVLEFCNEPTNLLESNVNSSGELILLGDLTLLSINHLKLNQLPFWTSLTVLTLSIRLTNPLIGYPILSTLSFTMLTQI